MPLTAGQTLSFYEVLGPLGAGGMGEVYRARDTRLGREVALKVLPEHFAVDQERLVRFEREAKALAVLNHPNVAQVYGIDQIGDTCFMALELVPGDDLAKRLAGGPLPLEEALDVGRQIAEGLEAAHDAGVVHRDLKPANVCITPDGKVKLLDFGLAKPMRERAGSSTTDSALRTEAGLVLGTPTYMAPEQARGKPIDRRVDIWAFGCVLFECLSGSRAFPGDDLVETLASIQQREPEWTALPRGTPGAVRYLLERCLQKDPRRRLRDIGEARLILAGDGAFPDPTARSASGVEPRGRVLPWLLTSAAVVFAAGAWAWTRIRSTDARGPTRGATRFTLDLPLAKRTVYDEIDSLAVSPDGRSVAFSVHGDRDGVFVRDLDSLDFRLLPETEGAGDLCFSPDGRWIAYHDGNRERLARIAREGGLPVVIGRASSSNGLDWSPRGILTTSLDWGAGLSAFRVDTGELGPLVPFDPGAGERNQLDPCFLPESEVVLYCAWTGASWDESLLVAFDPARGERKLLSVRGQSPHYLRLPSGGALLWVRSGVLWASRFDAERLECQGDPVVVLEGVAVDGGDGQAKYHVSSSGTLAFVPGEVGFGTKCRLLWVDRSGVEEPVLAEPGYFQTPALSSDGSRLAVTIRGPIFQVIGVDLLVPLSERRLRRLTFEADSYESVLSPDGAEVFYFANPEGDYRVYRRPFEGGAPVEVLRASVTPRCVSPDRRWLVYNQQGDVWVARLDGSAEPRALVATPAMEWDAQVSPDGLLLAYCARDVTGEGDVYVVAFPDGENKVQISRGGGSYPRWSSDGTELCYFDEGAYYATPVGSALSFGAPRKILEGDYGVNEDFGRDYCVGPDGRFLVLKPELPAEAYLRLVVVEDFAAELEAKLSKP